ncbi:MAG: hypothetical protein WAW07_15055 [Bacteroidales bacterium]
MKNLKILVLSTVLAFSIKQALAQEIQFTLHGLNPCTGKIENVSFYSLKKGAIYSPKDSTGTCAIPDTGMYTLTFFDEDKHYTFKEFKTYSDTLRFPAIQFCQELTTRVSFSGYCCCGTLCEGKQVDYYSNGNKRIEGFFNKGKPIGKLNFYYPTGQLKLVEEYNKRGKLLREIQYDTKGNLMRTK